jgi:hypothetical protein
MLTIKNINEALNQASANRTRLIFILPSEKLKAGDMLERLNLNELLAERLLNVARKDRAKDISQILTSLINASSKDVILLTGIEILFDRCLAVDPVRLLSACAKNKTLLVFWPGDKTSFGLSYAGASHPEHRTYKASDLSDVIYLEADD